MSNLANIKVSPETRDMVKSQKRGGDSYDDVLRKMVKQYDPEVAHEGNA
jgi:predicted CopG family antitoxin